jgi:hypothetical protein
LQDKVLSYLKVEDINDLVLIRTQFAQELNDNSSKVKFSDIYDLKRIIGAGGFGVVCEVFCRIKKQTIAVKIT